MELRFSLRYADHDVVRIVNVPTNYSLEKLNRYMLRILDWDPNHAYSFHFQGEPFTTTDGEYGSPESKVRNPAEFIFREFHLELNQHDFSSQKQMEQFIEEHLIGKPMEKNFPKIADGAKTRLQDLNLQPGQEFVYLFDWGDQWVFDVEVLSLEQSKKPRVIKSIGPTPEQYGGGVENAEKDEFLNHEIDSNEFEIYKQRHIEYGKKSGWIEFDSKKFDRPGKSKLDMRAFRTKSAGFIHLVLSYKPPQESRVIVGFDIDLVVDGVMNVYAIKGSLDRYFREFSPGYEMVRISTIEAQYLLTRGYLMSRQRNRPLDETTLSWLSKFRIPGKKLKGSPFRCFLCERGRLEKASIDILKNTSESVDTITHRLALDEDELNFYCHSCMAYLAQHLGD